MPDASGPQAKQIFLIKSLLVSIVNWRFRKQKQINSIAHRKRMDRISCRPFTITCNYATKHTLTHTHAIPIENKFFYVFDFVKCAKWIVTWHGNLYTLNMLNVHSVRCSSRITFCHTKKERKKKKLEAKKKQTGRKASYNDFEWLSLNSLRRTRATDLHFGSVSISKIEE